MNILVCSILRNRAFFIRRFYFLLNHLVRLDKNNSYSISIFENDSMDGTSQWIKAMDWSFFNKQYIKTTNLNLPFLSDSDQYAQSVDRVRILSWVRNQCIDQVGDDLIKYDKILFLEAECLYYPKDIVKLINMSKETHIYSPKSIMEKPEMLGDSWATRINSKDRTYEELKNIKVIDTPNDYLPLWSTYSYLCIYDIIPILNGIKFGFFNKRLNIPDCDTAVICENFRDKGYEKIFMNTNILVSHV